MISHLSVMIPASKDKQTTISNPSSRRRRRSTHHLDRTTERQLAVPLTEMQISQRQLGLVHVYRKVASTPSRQVLDIAIPTVFTRGDRSSTFSGNLVKDIRSEVVGGTNVGPLGQRQVGLGTTLVQIGRFQCGLSLVPGVEQLLRGSSSAEKGNSTILISGRGAAR